jgi:ABC-type Fe3+-hydroxamate transport system substrate-binding protein
VNKNRFVLILLLSFALSACGSSQSLTPVNPNVTTLNMSVTNATGITITMAPQTQDDVCVKRAPSHVTLAPNQRWNGTIALDKLCPGQRWSFGVTLTSGSTVAASAEWAKSNGQWRLLYLTSELLLKPNKNQGGIFNITLVKGTPPR